MDWLSGSGVHSTCGIHQNSLNPEMDKWLRKWLAGQLSAWMDRRMETGRFSNVKFNGFGLFHTDISHRHKTPSNCWRSAKISFSGSLKELGLTVCPLHSHTYMRSCMSEFSTLLLKRQKAYFLRYSIIFWQNTFHLFIRGMDLDIWLSNALVCVV